MVLELYVWGPAFGLPSLDPECLAAVAYFTQALDRSEWTIVRSSPSAIPTRRHPTLHNPQTSTWTAGLPSIIHNLTTAPPPTFRNPDSNLTPSQLGKTTAYTSYLTTSAAPLLSLSLYASSANWSSAVRPAYSAALPFPLGWTEVSPVRRAWIALADGTGIDLLDAEDAERPQVPEEEAGLPRDAKLRRKKGVRDLLSPEQKARIKLEAMVCRVMDVLEAQKGGKKWFLAGEGEGPTGLDCVAFGYLALMVYPDLPRPWLRDVIVQKYPGLQGFVNDMTTVCFGDGLPSAAALRREEGLLGVTGRFAGGVVRSVPGLGEEWNRFRDRGLGVRDVMLIAGGSVVAAALVVGYILRRRGSLLMPMLGAPVHRWDAPRRGLAGLGAAGALFGGLFSPEIRFGNVALRAGEARRVRSEFQAPIDGKVDEVEVDIDVNV